MANRIITLFSLMLVFIYQGITQPLTPPMANAAAFCDHMFDEAVHYTYCYLDGNSQCNEFIPYIEGDTNIIVTEQLIQDPHGGRTISKIVFNLTDGIGYTNWRYTYGPNNYGTNEGRYIGTAKKLIIWARGEGVVEFMLGGTNRIPFHNPSFPYQDGYDIRSTGFVTLTSQWTRYVIDLTDDRFWVYRDASAGLNNRFPSYEIWNYAAAHPYFDFNYNARDASDTSFMQLDWLGGTTQWACFAFKPADGFLQGYDLSEITKIHFKAKSTVPRSLEFLFCGGSYRVLIDSPDWKWYSIALPVGLDFSNCTIGFGFCVNGIQPFSLCLDSIYHEGVHLRNDSNIITGVGIVASQANNDSPVTVYYDSIYYDHSDYGLPRLAQSFLVHNDPEIDKTQQMAAHVYDNALLLITYLALYQRTCDERYLRYAELIGRAFIYARDHDRFYTDNRLRNVYKAGVTMSHNDTIRMAGWWDEGAGAFYEDIYFVSTSTGNMAWAGLAFTSLFEISGDSIFLAAAEDIANWCIASTWSDIGPGGFTGGYEGFENNQDTVTWKSTEHNLDLRALFFRLYGLTGKMIFDLAAQHAETFVLSMWDAEEQHFWTGTDASGIDINYNNGDVPLDIHPWFLMAFRDLPNIADYYSCMDWVQANCFDYFEIFDTILPAFDFNTDLDGAWFEGTAQAALAYKLIGNTAFANLLLATIEYVQTHGPFNNGQGIVAASIDHLTTGFNWEYHRRLHLGATCWYLLAALGVNPYFVPEATLAVSAEGGTINCANPSVQLNATSSNPGVSYSWEGPEGFTGEGSMVFVSQAGTYHVTAILPETGCAATATVVVTDESSTPSLSVAGDTISCINTEAELNASSSADSVTYEWLGPGGFDTTGNSIKVDMPGEYSVTVTDLATSCTNTATITVIEDLTPPGVLATGGVLTCNEPEIYLSGDSDAPNAVYTWAIPGGSTLAQQGLQVADTGAYTLTVYNPTNGCTSDTSVIVTANFDAPEVFIEGDLQLACFGNLTVLTAQADVIGTTFFWEGENIDNPTSAEQTVGAGSYSITATAPNGCSVLEQIAVSGPAELTIENDIVQEIDCEGYVAISGIIASGGTEPYTVEIFPALPIPPGTEYEITVTDANGCVATLGGTTEEHSPLSLEISFTNASSEGADDGTATVVVTNGVEPFSYHWSNDDTSDTITNLAPGIYNVTVTDSRGCTVSGSVEILTGTEELENVRRLALIPNPASGRAYLDLVLQRPARVRVEIADLNGRILWQTEEPLVLEKAINLDIENYPSGIYPVRIWIDGALAVRRLVVIRT
ncbi:MAG: hypothetical protein H6558_15580 [Lewinellaceae bacterium]|nr:hypothetical protein [Lewinellaceae bacterium]MCB9291508.1 hypothetical protein [Lewinellaceae bacterium]